MKPRKPIAWRNRLHVFASDAINAAWAAGVAKCATFHHSKAFHDARVAKGVSLSYAAMQAAQVVAAPTTRTIQMTPEQIHDIGRIAAMTAQSIVTTSQRDPSGLTGFSADAATAASKVVDAYMAAVKKLSAPSDPAAPASVADAR